MDNLLRSALKDDFAAGGTAALSHFDDVIRLGNKFETVFDDDDCVSVGYKFSEQGKKFFGILVVKTCGRLETPMECWSTTTAGVRFSMDSTFARS